MFKEKFDNTKGLIENRKQKNDIHCNGLKKKDKQ